MINSILDESSRRVCRCVIDLEKPGCVRTWRGDPHAAGVITAEVEAACLPPPLRQSSKEPQVLRLLRIKQVAVKVEVQIATFLGVLMISSEFS